MIWALALALLLWAEVAVVLVTMALSGIGRAPPLRVLGDVLLSLAWPVSMPVILAVELAHPQ